VLTNPVGEAEVADVSSTSAFACALLRDGHVECWGHNERGQLGRGTHSEVHSTMSSTSIDEEPAAPVVGLRDAVRISAGRNHACAVRRDGRVVCWGLNTFMQLGARGVGSVITIDDVDVIYDEEVATTPVLVPGVADVTDVAAGGDMTCAAVRSGAVLCWGATAGHAFGRALPEVASGPVAVPGIVDAVAVAVGTVGEHSCALHRSGSVVCWGRNDHGQLGSEAERATEADPTAVDGMADAVAISVGYNCACAQRRSGHVACWGNDERDQLGDGLWTDRPRPVDVPGVVNATTFAISLAGCAVDSAWRVRCWGGSPRQQRLWQPPAAFFAP
jgi:hypothetical protein